MKSWHHDRAAVTTLSDTLANSNNGTNSDRASDNPASTRVTLWMRLQRCFVANPGSFMRTPSSLRRKSACPPQKPLPRLWMSRTMVPFALLLILSAPARAATPSDLTALALDKCLNDPGNASTGGQTDCEETAAKAYDQRMN